MSATFILFNVTYAVCGGLMLGGLGTSEIILIAIALLVLFGAKKLPEIGKSLGKGLREFKKATNEITNSVNTGLNEDSKSVAGKVIEPTAEEKEKVGEKKA